MNIGTDSNFTFGNVPGPRSFSGYVEIDQSPCRTAYGFKEQLAWVSELSQEGRQRALEAIGNMVSEGDRMSHIESATSSPVEIAFDKTLEWKPVEVTLSYVPSPEIRYHPGSGRFVDISS